MRTDQAANSLKDKLYIWGGRDRITDGGRAFLRNGDVLYKETREDGSCVFTSGRGATVGYSAGDEYMDREAMPALHGAIGPEELDAALHNMERQAAYLDADDYRMPEDKSAAAAMFKCRDGYFSVLKEGGDYTLFNGITGGMSGWPSVFSVSFNPEGTRLDLRSDGQRYEAQQRARSEASPLGRIAAMVRGLAGVKPDPAFDMRPLDRPFGKIAEAAGFTSFEDLRDAARKDADMRKPVYGFEPGMAVTWTERTGPGHGIGSMPSTTRYMAVVSRNESGTGLRVVPVVADAAADGASGRTDVSKEGPFKDLGAAAGLCAVGSWARNMTSEEIAFKSVRIMPGGPLSEDALAVVQESDPVKPVFAGPGAPGGAQPSESAAFRSPGVRLHEQGAYARMQAAVREVDGREDGPGDQKGPEL